MKRSELRARARYETDHTLRGDAEALARAYLRIGEAATRKQNNGRPPPSEKESEIKHIGAKEE